MEDLNSIDVSFFLQTLNSALQDLQTKPLYYLQLDVNSSAIKALSDLQNRAPAILSPENSILFYLSEMKTLIDDLGSYQYYTPNSLIQCCLISYRISRVAVRIQRKIQLCFDRESIVNLVKVLRGSCNEEEKLRGLELFEDRISSGFDLELQDLILKERLFPILESILCDDSCPQGVRENAGSAIAALAEFNRNVFVGNVLMGSTVSTLVLMSSRRSIRVLTSLVRLMKEHLVDEMARNGEIPGIIGLLSSEDFEIRLIAMDCLLEIAYFSRNQVIEDMIECGLVEKLVFLQRTAEEIQNRATCEQEEDEDHETESVNYECSLDNHPFCGCLLKFAVQVEVGEVMEKGEKREIKMEILRRAREASVSEAEAATVVAEVLWGSHP